VVVRRGAGHAVEAIEGTTAAIRRGTALSGPGAVVVKGVAAGHDFRFDTPGIGPDTSRPPPRAAPRRSPSGRLRADPRARGDHPRRGQGRAWRW
jgi:hypothetical protein